MKLRVNVDKDTIDRVDEEFTEYFCEIVRGVEKTRRKFTLPTILNEKEQEVQYDDLQCVFMKFDQLLY